MQFVGGPEEDQKDSEDKSALDLIKDKAKNIVKCRICKEDHWTTNCPYKDTLGPLKDTLTSAEDKEAGGGAGGAAPAGKTNSYVSPNLRKRFNFGDRRSYFEERLRFSKSDLQS